MKCSQNIILTSSLVSGCDTTDHALFPLDNSVFPIKCYQPTNKRDNNEAGTCDRVMSS